jgi:hypothetical protein
MTDNQIDIASLTEGTVQGAGNFDVIMKSVKSHLNTEYTAGRITGDTYAQAYISALDLALTTANAFTLQYLITNQQAKLLEAQTDLAVKQSTLIASQKELLDSQVIGQKAQTELAIQQLINTKSQDAQILVQTNKLQAEIDVLTQRKLSEMAQTSNTLNGQPVGGLLGKQITLYTNQAEGYLRDAEQKAAKILNDTLLTRITTEYDSADASLAGQSDAEVKKVVDKLKQGIGVS